MKIFGNTNDIKIATNVEVKCIIYLLKNLIRLHLFLMIIKECNHLIK